MTLPNSYTNKTGAIHAYFEAMLAAEAPPRFSRTFLEQLEFNSSADRLFIGILKELGFLDADGAPTGRYFEFLDKERSWRVLADGIRTMFADLFAVNKDAQGLDVEGVYNKLRTLYKGTKKDTVIRLIAKTFVTLCELADFSKPIADDTGATEASQASPTQGDATPQREPAHTAGPEHSRTAASMSVASLQYHVNIVLPDTRDQSVYDAIFKSLRQHLG